MVTFIDLGVPDDLIDALGAQGIDAPFPIQASTIPPALEGNDVSGRAPTGSGKTLAFGIPLVANVERARPKRPRALVLVPTRELAAQVTRDLEWLGAGRDVRVHAFYGGTKFEPQVKALRRGVDIAVACPGRLADLVNQGIARLDGVDLVVIDEADRMADMGFLPEVRRLVDQTDPGRQTLLFSATLDGDVDALVQRYQHDPVTVDVTPEVEENLLEHHFWSVPHAQRIPITAAIIQRVGPTVVFTRTRHGADRVTRQLEREGVEAAAIHGSRTQSQRERALRAFRTGHAQALVATDVAARGIHVDDVTCVVHFDLPADPKDYIHRSGRTGRAGATGVVVALAMPDRNKDTKKLLRELKLGITVEDPDVESLPAGEPRAVTRTPGKRSDGGRKPSRAGAASNRHRNHHKPSGTRPARRFDSPDDTRPGRKKGTDAHTEDRRHRSGHTPSDRQGSRAEGSRRSDPESRREPRAKTSGPGSRGPGSRGPKPVGPKKGPKSKGPNVAGTGGKGPKGTAPKKPKKKVRTNRPPKGPRGAGRPGQGGPSGKRSGPSH